MVKSPETAKQIGKLRSKNNLYLVATLVSIAIVLIGVYIPLQPAAYGTPTDCYLSTNTGLCISLTHPVLITNGPLITTA
jgi:hypothetical protein